MSLPGKLHDMLYRMYHSCELQYFDCNYLKIENSSGIKSLNEQMSRMNRVNQQKIQSHHYFGSLTSYT